MNYQVTGNEYISLPTIRETDGAVEGVTFLYMRLKGLLEIHGDDGLIRPYLTVNGVRQELKPEWERHHYWIPSFVSQNGPIQYRCTYLTPIGERAFGLRIEVRHTDQEPRAVRFGVNGKWDQTLHEVNETTELSQGRESVRSSWNQMFIWSQKPGVPLFAFAPCVGDTQPFSEFDQGAKWTQDGFAYDIFQDAMLAAGETARLDIFFGIGYEAVAAATSAKELLRQGFDALYSRTSNWLAAREKRLPSPALETVLNTNMFFSFFFSTGRTVDTEELCLMTSRSPRYYVSAAYWDRDSLLWSFPAILLVDTAYAREMLLYVFTRQIRNVGIHSRYIDGSVLEPGFELDELCAPVIALERYLLETGDRELLNVSAIRDGLSHILRILESKKHHEVDLYETFLQPTDDMHVHPYLTYGNVLVWKALGLLADYLLRPELLGRAEGVRQAIQAFCVAEGAYIWSTDLAGHYDIYDEPPGSLQLLPFYGFCSQDDPVWRKTMGNIRSAGYRYSFAGKPIAEIGCAHAEHPWVLSICNSLLSGHRDTALLHLSRSRLDNGIACESVHEETGECATGEAFATCAGFLSYALWHSCSDPA